MLESAYADQANFEEQKTRARQFIDADVQVLVNMMEDEELKTRSLYKDTMWQYVKENFIIYLILTIILKLKFVEKT